MIRNYFPGQLPRMSSIIDLFNSENEMHDINITCMCKTNVKHWNIFINAECCWRLVTGPDTARVPRRDFACLDLCVYDIKCLSSATSLAWWWGVRPVCLSLIQTPVSVTQLPSPVEETLELLGQKEGGVHAVLDPPKS